jgi:hypothetical protein
MTTISTVSRNASKALMSNAQAAIHQMRPTVNATRTVTRPASAS